MPPRRDEVYVTIPSIPSERRYSTYAEWLPIISPLISYETASMWMESKILRSHSQEADARECIPQALSKSAAPRQELAASVIAPAQLTCILRDLKEPLPFEVIEQHRQLGLENAATSFCIRRILLPDMQREQRPSTRAPFLILLAPRRTNRGMRMSTGKIAVSTDTGSCDCR